MSTDEEMLSEVWSAIAKYCSDKLSEKTLQKAYRFRKRFLKKVEPSDWISLLSLHLLEAAASLKSGEKLSQQQIFRIADRAAYELKRSIRKIALDIDLVAPTLTTSDNEARSLLQQLQEELSASDMLGVDLMLELQNTEEVALRLNVSRRKVQQVLHSIPSKVKGDYLF